MKHHFTLKTQCFNTTSIKEHILLLIKIKSPPTLLLRGQVLKMLSLLNPFCATYMRHVAYNEWSLSAGFTWHLRIPAKEIYP
jgi:hypothetical protein